MSIPPPLPPRTGSSVSAPPLVAPSPPIKPAPATAPRPTPPPLPTRRLPPSAPTRSTTSTSLETPQTIEGIDNHDLHILLRTFDKQVHAVAPVNPTRISSLPPFLDFHPSVDEAFMAAKLKSNTERFYASVIVGMIRFAKEVDRIRNWKESSRSLCFLSAYVLAWYYNLITASLLSFFSILILVPSSRLFFFTPAPILSGTPTQPTTSTSLPFVPGSIPGLPVTDNETVEQDATDFADALETIALAGATGQDPGAADEMSEAGTIEESVEEVAAEVSGGKAGKLSKEEKKAAKRAKKEAKERKKEEILGKHGKLVMVLIGDLADGWERWANAFSPTAPYPSHASRLSVFYSILLPIIISTTIFPEWVFSRATGIFIGLLFFGQPLLSRFGTFLDEKFPQWQEKMELRNGILAGVPTNAQLTIRLLRDAEARLQPLPSPPPATLSTSDEADLTDEESIEEVTMLNALEEDPALSTTSPKKKAGDGKAKFSAFIKSAARLTEQGAGYLSGQKQIDYHALSRAAISKLSVDPNNQAAKALLSVIPNPALHANEGPSTFFVNDSGKPGHIIIHAATPMTPAFIVFTTVSDNGPSPSRKSSIATTVDSRLPSTPSTLSLDDQLSTASPPIASSSSSLKSANKKSKLTFPASDIVKVRKRGIGFTSGFALSYLSGLEGVGGTGLEVTIKREWGEVEVHRFSAIVRRDELFRRLISIGDQRWERM